MKLQPHLDRSRWLRFAAGILCCTITTSVSVTPVSAESNSERPRRMPSVHAVQVKASQARQTPQSPPTQWLPSTTAKASFAKSRQAIERSRFEYDAKAWVSAENSAWEAIRQAAHGIDQNHVAHPMVTAVKQYEYARAAMLDARDFAGYEGPFNAAVAKRLMQSHQNKLLMDEQLDQISSLEAAACYLNIARVRFAELAAQSMEAAQAMDLLAAIYLDRDEARMMPSESALCLRRAALQGQPQNADLAAQLGAQLVEVGLLDEAQWALEHSLAITFAPEPASALIDVLNQRGDSSRAQLVMNELRNRPRSHPTVAPRLPQITEVSPAQFAAMSRPVQNAVSSDHLTSRVASMPTHPQRSSVGVPAKLASARIMNQIPRSFPAASSTSATPRISGGQLIGGQVASGQAVVSRNGLSQSTHEVFTKSAVQAKKPWYGRLPKLW